jgi:hypothetical protein
MTLHRWVLHDQVPDHLRCGWLAVPSLEGTGHGIYSAHCIWLCDCTPAAPGYLGMSYEEWKREKAMAAWMNEPREIA